MLKGDVGDLVEMEDHRPNQENYIDLHYQVSREWQSSEDIGIKVCLRWSRHLGCC